jgi:hypothetical protein
VRPPLPSAPLAADAPRVPATAARAPGQPWGKWEPPSVRPLAPPDETPERPIVLKLALRVGLGIAGFVLITAVRQCDPFGESVHDLLAEWDGRAFDEDGPTVAGSASRHGPPALEWMLSDLNQFNNPDKDLIRGMVQRYLKAGALGVYVTDISRDMFGSRASGIIVELPENGPSRDDVFAAHASFFEVGRIPIGVPDSTEDTGQDTLVVRF